MDYIKNGIIMIVAENDAVGIEEPELRDELRTKYNIRESRGIKKHLTELANDRILLKKRKMSNIWKINPEVDFKNIASRFLRDEWNNELFMKTSYVENILTNEFLIPLVNNWIETCGVPYWIGMKGNIVLRPKIEVIESLFPSLKDSHERLFVLTRLARKSPFFLWLILFPEEGLNSLSSNLQPLIDFISQF